MQVETVFALSEEEVAVRAQILASKIVERNIAKDDAKSAAESAREAIKSLDEAIDKLADQVHTKTETRMVEQQGSLFDGARVGEQEDDDDGEIAETETGVFATRTEPVDPDAPLPEGAEITDPAAIVAGSGEEDAPKRGRKKKHAAELAS
jgi:hypothetical protein